MSRKDREAWVRDLFERVYETVSLLNVDHLQQGGSVREARSIPLSGKRLRSKPLHGDEVTLPRRHAMTKWDALRNNAYTVPGASSASHCRLANMRARATSRSWTPMRLLELVAEHPDRLEALIRQPFQVEKGETASTDYDAHAAVYAQLECLSADAFGLAI